MGLRNRALGLRQQIKYINNPEKSVKNTSNYNECTLVCNKSNVTHRFKYTLH
jgi:hypothetical protein